MRCSKVHRRASLSDLASNEGGHITTGTSHANATTPSSSVNNNNHHNQHQSTGSSSNSGNSNPPPTKRQKNTKSSTNKTASNPVNNNSENTNNSASSNTKTDQWNHLAILADCVTSLSSGNNKNQVNFTQGEDKSKIIAPDPATFEPPASSETLKTSRNSMEEEFVCNIRIPERAFLPYSSSSSPTSVRGANDPAVFMFTSAFLLNQSIPTGSMHHNLSKDSLLLQNDSGRSSSATTTNTTNTSSNNSSDTSSEDNNAN